MIKIHSIIFDKIKEYCNKDTNINSSSENILQDHSSPIHTNFLLPIQYLDPSEIHSLSPVVANDLELARPGVERSIYEYIFKPQSKFATNMIPSWSQCYTTNKEYLEDTQYILKNMKDFGEHSSYIPKYDKIMEIWDEIKVDTFFLEKYGFLEWDILQYLNESSNFLQCLTVANIVSPLISLFMPLLFLILPFIILKFRGIPIDFEIYMEVLQSVAKNHFIGKALGSIHQMTIEKGLYLIFIGSLYFLQIYQNINICIRFYRNIVRINDYLMELKGFIGHSISSMCGFRNISQDLRTYKTFHNVVWEHCETLKQMQSELECIRPFEVSLSTINNTGYMLKCFYTLHTNIEYENALRYSMGFQGYIENLMGVYENISSRNLAFCTILEGDKIKCEFKDQYYPPLIDECHVKNNICLDKNIILSAPNKSGKTTVLKTTALNIIFTQQLGCGFYSSGELLPYSHIHSYLNIPDTSERDSLFQAESRRCKDILNIVTKYENNTKYRHFCIFDELYSGTNPEEAVKAGYAFLKYLSKFENIHFILTTHYVKICKKFLENNYVENYKMHVKVLENGDFYYTYRMKKGISMIKGAIRVMKDMEYPEEIIGTMESDNA